MTLTGGAAERRPLIDHRAARAGIVFVLKTRDHLKPAAHEPGQLVGGRWRRLRDRTEAGMWLALHERPPDQLRVLSELNLTRAQSTGRAVVDLFRAAAISW